MRKRIIYCPKQEPALLVYAGGFEPYNFNNKINPPSWMKSAIADEIVFGGYKNGFNFIEAVRL